MIVTDRNTYIAAHITPETKEKLRIAAAKKKISMSMFISMILVEKLKQLETEEASK